jgi:hypothetical protein
VNIRVIRVLITSGAFRTIGTKNDMWKEYARLRKGTPAELHTGSEWKVLRGEIMPWVKQTIRDMFPDKVRSAITHDEFLAAPINKRVVIVGFIAVVRLINSKRGNMYILKIEDAGSTFTVVCWNDRYQIMQDKGIEVEVGAPVKISGYKNLSHMDEEQITMGKEPSSYIKVLM